MANRNFIVQNGLQVGPLTIDAATGSINTTGTVSVSGLSVSEISKNDSKISINDTGSSSNIQMTIDGTVEHTVSTNGVNLATGSWYAINGTSVLSATALGTGITSSGLTSVGTLTGLSVSGTVQLTSTTNNNGVQYNSGAVQIAGGTGINGNLFVGGNLFVAGNTTVVNTSISNSVTGNLVVGPGLNFVAVNANIQYSGNQNSYLQMQMQNRNSGTAASTDYVATANNGTDTDTYIDLGINGSGYVPSSPFLASYPNDGYLYVQGNTTTGGGNLMLATMTNKSIYFATNGQNTNNIVMSISSGNVVSVLSSAVSSSTTTGALVVTGGLGVSGNTFVGNLSTTSVKATTVYDNNNRVLTSLSSTGTGNLTVSVSAPAGTTVALPVTGPGVTTTGSATAIPVITTDAYGRIAGITTAAVSSTLNIAGSSGSGTVSLTSQTLTVSAGTGITTSASGQTITVTNSGVTGLAGTTNQITASAGTGSVTLSLPTTVAINTLNAATIGNVSSAHIGATGRFDTSVTTATLNAATVGNAGAVLYGTLNSSSASQPNVTTLAGLTGFGTTGLTTTALGNFTVTGNLTVNGSTNTINNTIVETTEYVVTTYASSVYAATLGNIGANHVGTGTYLTSLNASNLSSGTVPSAQVSGSYTGITAVGSLTGLTVNGTIVATTLNASTIGNASAALTGGTLNITGGAGAGTLVSTNTSTGNLIATAGSVGTLVASTGFSTANAIITSFGGTTGVVTNFSSGNITGTFNGTVAQTVATANVSIYESVTATSTNATFYPMIADKTAGNTSSFTTSTLSHNPFSGNLSATGFIGTHYGAAGITSGTITGTTTYNASTVTTTGLTVTGNTAISSTLYAYALYDAGSRVLTGITSNQVTTALGYTPTQIATTGNVNSVISTDSRSINYQPQDRNAGLYVDFKQNTTDSLADGGTYHGVVTFRSYGSSTDLSGGQVQQIAYTDNNNLWHRISTNGTTWGSWIKVLDSNNYSSYTISTANVSIYESVTALTTNQTFYPTFSNTSSTGNTITGVNSSFTFNPGTGNLSVGQLVSSVATGTAPLYVASSTKVTNLNAELVDGYHADAASTVNTIAVRDASANITSTGFVGRFYGTASVTSGTITGTTTYNAGAVTSSGSITATTATGLVGIATDSGGAISLGLTNGTASSPYIDFNTSTSAVDYNVRIQASGPATGVGAGALTITANSGVSVQGSITPSANVTYNIGSSSSWWNKFYGVAMQSQYADLAENYQADKLYSTGFVLMFGGTEEVTLAEANTTRVAGVVSTNPAHLMNGGLVGPNVVPLALTGRVPCRIIGPVKKGDMMISAGWGYAKATDSPQLGQVIGKALEDFPMTEKGIIEIVVGRL